MVGIVIVVVVFLIAVGIKVANDKEKKKNEQGSPSGTPAHGTSAAASKPVEPYPLKTNELPQGKYLIGRDIPPGVYDFFVVYGTKGSFDLGRYDANGKKIDGTWTFFWVGLKEEYEKRELIHVNCQEGETLVIKGNVILKIAKSQKVRIDLWN